VFDAVLQSEGSSRLARRAAYVVGSTAIQAAVALALVAVMTAMSSAPRRELPPAIEVKFVKGAPRPALPPPAPPPRKTALARPTPRPAAPQPVAPMVQPKEVPDQLPAPGPPEPELAPPQAGPGVIGGAVGGAEHLTGPPARLDFDAASMTRPVFASGPDPTYTRAALSHDVEGLMVVACVVTREGVVRDCRVQQGLPYMDAAVVQALERRRYRPAMLRGEPVEVTYQFRLNLRLPR
jgi:TonB family protein